MLLQRGQPGTMTPPPGTMGTAPLSRIWERDPGVPPMSGATGPPLSGQAGDHRGLAAGGTGLGGVGGEGFGREAVEGFHMKSRTSSAFSFRFGLPYPIPGTERGDRRDRTLSGKGGKLAERSTGRTWRERDTRRGAEKGNRRLPKAAAGFCIAGRRTGADPVSTGRAPGPGRPLLFFFCRPAFGPAGCS